MIAPVDDVPRPKVCVRGVEGGRRREREGGSVDDCKVEYRGGDLEKVISEDDQRQLRTHRRGQRE